MFLGNGTEPIDIGVLSWVPNGSDVPICLFTLRRSVPSRCVALNFRCNECLFDVHHTVLTPRSHCFPQERAASSREGRVGEEDCCEGPEFSDIVVFLGSFNDYILRSKQNILFFLDILEVYHYVY